MYCAAVLLAVLCLLVAWVNAGVNRREASCILNEVDVKSNIPMPKTACPVNITDDNDANRIPAFLYMVKCTSCTSNCPDKYTCTQLRTKIKVKYNTSSELEDFTLYTGCVCSLKEEGKQAIHDTVATFR